MADIHSVANAIASESDGKRIGLAGVLSLDDRLGQREALVPRD